jgi:phosphate transport system permease protein
VTRVANEGAPNPLLATSGNLRRRLLVNRGMEIAAWIAAVLAVAVLALVIASVAVKGLSSISLDFLTKSTVGFGAGGGIANAILGTGILVGLATLMAVPVGILVAIYTSEFAGPRNQSAIRYVLDVLNGVPTIVTGIFIFGLLVAGHQQSGFAGSVALAIVMLPLVARSCHEVLTLVPGAVKEAGLALGASRWRTTLSVVVPTALSGMLTGALLAIARAAGETAPLLFTTSIFLNGQVQTDPSQALPNIPVVIFQYSEAPEPAKHAQAWAAALILIAFVLVISIVARILSARMRRRLGAAR